MEILPITLAMPEYKKQLAALLQQAFPHAYGTCSQEKATLYLDGARVALGAVEEGELLGFVGATPQYGVTAWELHPLIIRLDRRGTGIGRMLCATLESALRERGCLTVYLGTDDEQDQTSLFGTDLFVEPFRKIEQIENRNGHPYAFYQKLGYQIVGVLPDANGLGKPDIWMAKSLVRPPANATGADFL